MRITTLLILLISFTAYGQDTKTTGYDEHWDVIKALDFPAQLTFKGYKRFVFEPLDTATYTYKITRERKIWALIKVEAEATTITSNVDKPTDGPTDHKGYIRPIQGWLPWSVTYTVAFAKQTKIMFVYQNGNAPCNVTVSIGTVVKNLTLPMTGTSWANAAWQSYSFDIGEFSGNQTVKITYAIGINVDYFTLR